MLSVLAVSHKILRDIFILPDYFWMSHSILAKVFKRRRFLNNYVWLAQYQFLVAMILYVQVTVSQYYLKSANAVPVILAEIPT